MKQLVIIFTLLLSNGYSQITPCQNYACDSVTVRAILDSNGLNDLLVVYVSDSLNGRIISLDFTSRNLTTLIPEIGKLSALSGLNLRSNQISSLPNEIGNLTSLIGLVLDNNNLTELPIEIGNLTALKTLHLVNNQLKSLPSEIGKLTALKNLFLQNNELTSLPTGIIQLDIFINIYNNRLCSLPDSIANWIDMHIIGNWRETQKLDDTHYCDGTLIK